MPGEDLDRMARVGNKDRQTNRQTQKQTLGFQRSFWLIGNKVEILRRRVLMTITASQCDNTAVCYSFKLEARPRTVAQMDQVRPAQTGAQSNLLAPWPCDAPCGDTFQKHLFHSQHRMGQMLSVTSVLCA